MDFLDDIWDFVDRTATSGWDLATSSFDKALDYTESAFDWQFTHDYATAAQGQTGATGTSGNAGTQAAGTSYVAPTASGSDNTMMYVLFGVAGLLGAVLIAKMVK